MIKLAILKCKKCGHEWGARTESPKACPACKRYDWNKEKKRTLILQREDL